MSAGDLIGGHAGSIASHARGGASTLEEVPDDRDHGDYQEDVNESPHHREDKETQNPKDDEHQCNGEKHGYSAR